MRARLLRAVLCTVTPLALTMLEPALVPAVLQWYYVRGRRLPAGDAPAGALRLSAP